MAHLIGTQTAGPPTRRQTTDTRNHRRAVDIGDRQVAHADRADTSIRITHLHYRKARRDYPCIRIIAASAIVAGLLLGAAPLALSQVSHLLATVPAAFAQQVPSLTATSLDASGDSAG